ncbi:MAG: hypothetical protein ACYC35_09070 [Pirellulales bacterium]
MERCSYSRKLSRPTAGSLLALVILVVVGCGGRTNWDSTENGQLFFLVSGVAEAAQRPESFQSLFASGSVPADAAPYKKYTYQGDQQARISDDTAAMTVIVRDAKSGNEIARKEWTAVKEGGAWKLKTAPLP